MTSFVKILLISAISVFCASCALLNRESEPPQKQQSILSTGSEQLAYMYNPSITTIHPKVFVRKSDAQNFDLYVVINDSELLFSKANTQNKNIAKVKIFYKIIESYENNLMIDSCMRVVTFNKSETSKVYAVKLALKNVDLDKFVVQTTVTDLQRGKMNISFSEVDKLDSLGAINYQFSKQETMQPLPENYMKVGDQVRVDFVNPDYPEVFRTYYEPCDNPALLPYASDPAIEDTTHFYNTESEKRNFLLNASKEGVYYFAADTVRKTGVAIPCFSSDYPNITSLQDLAKPLAYLSTPAEYSSIINAEHKKLAIDEFWYSCTKDVKKAKELMKVFYVRALFANMYFYDYRQGMLTDRGMVYILMGAPKILALTSKSEIWTYKDSRSGQKVKFVFRKERTPLCGCKYVLYRSTEHKPYWDYAVSQWRKGVIFSW